MICPLRPAPTQTFSTRPHKSVLCLGATISLCKIGCDWFKWEARSRSFLWPRSASRFHWTNFLSSLALTPLLFTPVDHSHLLLVTRAAADMKPRDDSNAVLLRFDPQPAAPHV